MQLTLKLRMEKHKIDFQSFLSEKFPPDSKRGTSGTYYPKFGERIKATIKDPSTADKNLRFYVKKNKFQLLDLPSLDARDVLVVPAKQQVIE